MALHFRKVFLSAERYESASAFDVNGDGIVDIVSGAFWYEGLDFRKRHKIGGVSAHDDYYDDFSTIPLEPASRSSLQYQPDTPVTVL